ncbi:MAG: peptide chain release factor 2 [Pseudomonadota bacterium]
MSYEQKQMIKGIDDAIELIRGYLDLPGKENRLKEIEHSISRAGFWDNPDRNKSILQERTALSSQVETFYKLKNDLEDCRLLYTMAVEESDNDSLAEVTEQIKALDKSVKNLSLRLMLTGENDQNNAIISINAGAGGTEAQDWAEMLFRMYLRWAERKGYKTELIDLQPGDEAGIKSATFTAGGDYAYGYLKSEIGVHRLVRISPYNANGKRHTSFSSVFVYPELNNDIEVEINDKDLRIDIFRASGAGGQHVNKTSSAIRITHLPTNIVVQCQQERSQHRNRDLAMKVLKARLYQHEKQKQDDKLQEIQDAKTDIAFGNQIRSYILHPYQMAKDHRIGLDIGNVSAVLDGDIDAFIEGVLMSGKGKG